MHPALRSSLTVAAVAVCAAASIGCQTHYRRLYSTHQDKNLHTPDPWASSTTKAADEASATIDAAARTSPTADSETPPPVPPPPAQ